jgi:SAM-dependent methyltransferase
MAALLEMVQSHRITAVIYSAAKLGLAEALRGGPRSAEQLASALGADAVSLHRLLVALSTLGLCTIGEHGEVTLTDLGNQLDEEAENSLRDWVIFEGEILAKSWTGLVDSIRSGKTAAQLQGLENSFELMARTPANVAIFNAAMTNLTRLVTPAVIAACDFSRSNVVMDVGCGSGELLTAVLSRHSRLHGIGFDLARCADGANEHSRRNGLSGRFKFIAGDFFEQVPPGADTLLLKSVVHDWNDERSSVILANCRRALPDGGRLILIERLMPDRPSASTEHRSHALSDLNMLRGPGGCERTSSEYSELLRKSGLKLKLITPAGLFSVLKAYLDERPKKPTRAGNDA